MEKTKPLHIQNDPASIPSCDWKAPKNKGAKGKGQRGAPKSRRLFGAEGTKDNTNKIYSHKGNFRWSGVKTEKYKEGAGQWSAISRHVLIGNHGETAKFHLRYFEIAPNGYSSLEKHRHEHVVICIRGKGRVLINKKIHTINYLDTVYIAPNTVHQLTNPYDEPFGFFCIVNAKRDKPKSVKASSVEGRAHDV